MNNLSLLDVNKPEKLKEVLNTLLNYMEDLGEIPEATKESIGLGNVDNTSDINKPISNPTKNYVDTQNLTKVDKAILASAETANGLISAVISADLNSPTIDSATLQVIVRSIKTGNILSQNTINLKLASSTSRGLMSKEDYITLSNLVSKVSALEGKASRYIYTTKTNPTASEISEFATSLGHSVPFTGVSIVVNKTYHIWHYYENDNIGWKDDGYDTVGQASNDVLGIVKGSTTAGKVYIENDGTMSVVDFDELQAKVNSLENESITESDVESMINSAIGAAIGGSY